MRDVAARVASPGKMKPVPARRSRRSAKTPQPMPTLVPPLAPACSDEPDELDERSRHVRGHEKADASSGRIRLRAIAFADSLVRLQYASDSPRRRPCHCATVDRYESPWPWICPSRESQSSDHETILRLSQDCPCNR